MTQKTGIESGIGTTESAIGSVRGVILEAVLTMLCFVLVFAGFGMIALGMVNHEFVGIVAGCILVFIPPFVIGEVLNNVW